MPARVVTNPKAPKWERAALTLQLPPGDQGVYCTLAAMRAVIEHAAAQPELQAIARRFGQYQQAAPRRIYEWLRDSRRFRRDPRSVELLRHPCQVLAQLGAGVSPAIDCDDVAMLGASLLRALNIPRVLVVYGKDAGGPFTHVFYGTFDLSDGRGPWVENERPAGFVPWDPQEWLRVAPGQMPPLGRMQCVEV